MFFFAETKHLCGRNYRTARHPPKAPTRLGVETHGADCNCNTLVRCCRRIHSGDESEGRVVEACTRLLRRCHRTCHLNQPVPPPAFAPAAALVMTAPSSPAGASTLETRSAFFQMLSLTQAQVPRIHVLTPRLVGCSGQAQ